MKRLRPPEETESEYYVLPAKQLKLQLKAHPAHTLQVLKDHSLAVLNSGEKVMIFDLRAGLADCTSGLVEVYTNSQLLKRCLRAFYPVRQQAQGSRKGYIHPSFMHSVHEYQIAQGESTSPKSKED